MVRKLTGDNIFKILAGIIAASAAVILLLNADVLITGSVPVLQKFGASFLTGNNWNSVVFGKKTSVSKSVGDKSFPPEILSLPVKCKPS